MTTVTRHTTSHLAAQLCSGLTSVATNCDTESGITYIGPLFKMATLTRRTTNHMAAQLCSGLTSVATNCDTESGINYIGPLFKMAAFTQNIFSGYLASIGGGRSRPYKKENGHGIEKKDDFIPGIKIQTALKGSAAVQYNIATETEFESEFVGNKWLKFQSPLNKEATGEKKRNTTAKVLKF